MMGVSYSSAQFSMSLDYYLGTAEKSDWAMLKHAFRSKVASLARQLTILRDHGVRWAAFNLLSDWLPASKTVLDFMHNVFLGLICHFYMEVLFRSYMFSGAGGNNSQKKRFEQVINSIEWPSHITRLPKNLGENQSLKKADEWRVLIAITPVILWWTWRDANDQLPPGEPPVPPNAANPPQHQRTYQAIYAASLKLATGVRVLASRTISMNQAKLGQEFLTQYNQAIKRLGVHTTINHHLSTHYLKFIKLFGPVYGWWLFAFERFNGMLEKVKHNGHDGGRMELTLMRNWVMTHLVYDYLVSLPENAHDMEKKYIEKVVRQEGRENRGGLMTELAIYRAEAAIGNNISLPRRLGKTFDVSTLLPGGLSYTLLLRYLQGLWPDLNLVSDNSSEPGTPFYRSTSCRLLAYVRKDGIRYGSLQNKKTLADSKVFLLENSRRVPVEIIALLMVRLGDKQPHVCALVHRMRRDNNIPPLPWDLYASTLGIYTTYANQFDQPEVIPISRIDSALAKIPIHSNVIGQDLWALTGNEPDDLLDDDDEAN
ncbi:hypothetical protein D9615_003304 [Tricholomella constricta]|uniref:Uncharacterized protein n=1 Tax=Tricholomella constricta TaxID=117010 RepID=A0A8H5M8E0_9AGAR|nr:hypothetical protein D9615_003304 [Tricholomella constricta]